MSDARYLSKKFIKEFIDLYRSLPSLWNLKSKEYYDRSKKNTDYEIMVNKLREVEPEATRVMVTQKINSWRSSRRKETAKIKQSIEAGGDLYVPKLWYYKLMDFLDGQETFKRVVLKEREEKDDNGSDNDSSPQSEDDIDTGSVAAAPCRSSVSSTNSSHNRTPCEPHNMPPVVAFTTEPSPKRRKRKLAKVAKEETRTVNHEAFGRYIAHKLENLPFKQRIYVEKLINDAIFEAELGNLNRNCYVHVPAVSDTE